MRISDWSSDVCSSDLIGHTPGGRRRVIPITGGTVTGQLSGRILPGGADFQAIRSHTFTDIHARYVIETDQGEMVYVENTGIRTGPAEDIPALAHGKPVDHTSLYFRRCHRFETTPPTTA